ncbi:MAG: xanthine dehydrogenase [Oligoflexia bacterium]|nr:xanthine dehydrogenase [Oligoflexia bacterium]
MRNFISFYLNHELVEVQPEDSSLTLATYLRKKKSLTGTKIVCAEGDCGACTVLVKRVHQKNTLNRNFETVNSCIAPLYLLDSCHIVTVEGIENEEGLNNIQQMMVENQGSQCGYCTPGFICALAGMAEETINEGKEITVQRIKNHTTGNLCRCTGYLPIIESAQKIDLKKIETLEKRYFSNSKEKLEEVAKETVRIETQDYSIYAPTTLKEALEFKEGHNPTINSGGTDVGVWINKRGHDEKKFLSLNKIDELYEFTETSDAIEIGSKVTLTKAAQNLDSSFPEFSRKMKIFASPQIKNKGTLIGNMANGSPIGDSIPFMLVSNSIISLASLKGQRTVPTRNFYLGYKTFDMKDNEIITKVTIPKTDSQFKLYKISARKDLDISAVTLGVRYKIEQGKLKDFSLAIGGVGPVVYINDQLEQSIIGQNFNIQTIDHINDLYQKEITPFSDLRGSDKFRRLVVRNLLYKFYDEVNIEMNSFQEASL